MPEKNAAWKSIWSLKNNQVLPPAAKNAKPIPEAEVKALGRPR